MYRNRRIAGSIKAVVRGSSPLGIGETNAVLTPSCANKIAAANPAGPAPEIMAVKSAITKRARNAPCFHAWRIAHTNVKDRGIWRANRVPTGATQYLSLIHISEPTRQAEISYA